MYLQTYETLLLIILGIIFSFMFLFQGKTEGFDNAMQSNELFESKIPKQEIFVINLDRSSNRLEFCKQNFKKCNIKLNRVRGIDGKTIKITDYPHMFKVYNRFIELFATNTRKMQLIGSILSHFKAWKQAIRGKDDNDFVIIAEDDIKPNIDFNKQFSELRNEMENKDPNWDMLFIYSSFKEHVSKEKLEKFDKKPNIYVMKRWLGSGVVCYAIRVKHAKYLLEYYKKGVLDTALDTHLTQTLSLFHNYYIIHPSIIETNILDSSFEKEGKD